jgi:hypothetical protein
MYLCPLIMPAVHFIYFKLHWHPGQYETPGPSWTQLGQFLRWVKGTAGLDFMSIGMILTLVAVLRHASPLMTRELLRTYRAAGISATVLFVAGTMIYLPLPMVAARYTMPAVWGTDILFALLLTAGIAIPFTRLKQLAWAGLFIGLAAVAVANLGRQDRVVARSRLLWEALRHVENAAPPGARIAWASGEGRDALNVEEGIHFQWHLIHRGRGDVRILLYDESGQPITRTELPGADGQPEIRIAGPTVPDSPGWEPLQPFAVRYRLGAKSFACTMSSRVSPPDPGSDFVPPDARLAALMQAAFETLAVEGKLNPAPSAEPPATAERTRPREGAGKNR